MRSSDELNRLKGIEKQLIQIKMILLIVLALLVFGLFGHIYWVAMVGFWVISLVVLGAFIYGVLFILDRMVNRKLGPSEMETESKILEEIEQEKRDKSEASVETDGAAQP